MKPELLRYPPLAPNEPHKPLREDFNASGGTTIYHDVQVIGDCDINLKEYFEEMEEELPEPKLGWHQITLQDIVDLAPADAKLSDIRLHISYPRMAEYLEVKFYHKKRNLQKEEEEFQVAMQIYQDKYLVYQQKMVEYQIKFDEYGKWKKQQVVKQLEEQLAELKK